MTQSGDRELINECKGECKLSLEIYSSCSWATCLLALPACVHELGCCPCRVGCRSAPPGLQTGARGAQLRLGRLSCVLGRVTDPAGPRPAGVPGAAAVFSFLYFLKIKISKIYVHFEIFQKYTPVALP